MGLLGGLFDLGAEIVKVPINITKAIAEPIIEVVDDVGSTIAEDLKNVAKDINDNLK